MNRRFILILCTVVGMTLLCGATALAIAAIGPEPRSPLLSDLFKTCMTLFQTGTGTIIGLLAGHR